MSIAAAIINEKSNEPTMGFFNTTVNYCKISKGLVGNFVVQMLLRDLSSYTNATLTCPYKKVIDVKNPLIFQSLIIII